MTTDQSPRHGVPELFWLSGSPYAWRVLLALELKRLDYVSRRLEFADLKTPAHLALNPRGKVPVLRDGDYVLYESVAILAYLDRKYPEPALFGGTPEDTGRVWQLISEYSAYLDTAVEDFILPIYFGRAAEQAEQIRRAAATIHAELRLLEARLADRPFLAGDALTAADLVVFPAVQSIQRAASKPSAAGFDLRLLPLADTWPRLAAWMERIEAIPGYQRTYPPHWK